MPRSSISRTAAGAGRLSGNKTPARCTSMTALLTGPAKGRRRRVSTPPAATAALLMNDLRSIRFTETVGSLSFLSMFFLLGCDTAEGVGDAAEKIDDRPILVPVSLVFL